MCIKDSTAQNLFVSLRNCDFFEKVFVHVSVMSIVTII
jgi:hypothetical protein